MIDETVDTPETEGVTEGTTPEGATESTTTEEKETEENVD